MNTFVGIVLSISLLVGLVHSEVCDGTEISVRVSVEFSQNSVEETMSYESEVTSTNEYTQQYDSLSTSSSVSSSDSESGASSSASEAYASVADLEERSTTDTTDIELEKTTFIPDFRQIIREVTTTVQFNGVSKQKVDKEFVDSVRGKLTVAQLTEREEAYLDRRFGTAENDGKGEIRGSLYEEVVCQHATRSCHGIQSSFRRSYEYYEQAVKETYSELETAEASSSYMSEYGSSSISSDVSSAYNGVSGTLSTEVSTVTNAVREQGQGLHVIKKDQTTYQDNYLQLIRVTRTEVTNNGRTARTEDRKIISQSFYNETVDESLSPDDLYNLAVTEAQRYQEELGGTGKIEGATYTETVCVPTECTKETENEDCPTAKYCDDFKCKGPGYIELWKGNNIAQAEQKDKICKIQFTENQKTFTLKRQEFEDDERFGCDNDEARSMRICNVKKGTIIYLYDNGEMKRKNIDNGGDDYVSIEVLSNLVNTCKDINTFEKNADGKRLDGWTKTGEALEIVYCCGGNLDGKVSSFKYESP